MKDEEKTEQQLIDELIQMRHRIGVLEQAGIRSQQTEEALRKSEAFNFALFQYSGVPTVVVDVEGRVVIYNLAKRCSGDRLPVIGDVMYIDYAGKHELDMHAELMRCIGSGMSKEFPVLKYGDKFLFVNMSPFPQGAMIMCKEITDPTHTQEALQEGEQRFRDLADLLPLIVFETDLQGNLIYGNRCGFEVVGYTPEDVDRGLNALDLFIPEDREAIKNHTVRILNGEDPMAQSSQH